MGRKGRAGFARAPLSGTFRPLLPSAEADPLEAVAMYLETADGRFLFIALDFGQLARHHCTEIRERLANYLDIPSEAVVIHSTHTHAAPMCEDFADHPMDDLVACLGKVADKAMDAAVPARMAFGVADVGDTFSLCRRKWINDETATLTHWYGYGESQKGKSVANHLIRERLQRWFGRGYRAPEWLEEPVYYDAPVDPLVQMLGLQDQAGKSLGGMVRFAAHPHLLLTRRNPYYTPDYCGVARRWLDRNRGGIHLFLQGPSGNLVPREGCGFVADPSRENWADSPYGPDGTLIARHDEALVRSVREMGEGIAARALQTMQEASFDPLERLEVRTGWRSLPLRTDVPQNSARAVDIRDGWGRRIRRSRHEGCSLIEMKRLTDQYNRFHWMQKMLDEWYFPTAKEIAGRALDVHLQAIRLNHVSILGLPGECGRDTSLWLRAHTVGRDLVTLYECNGDVGYIVGAQDQAGGCYEAMCSLVAPEGERVLCDKALEVLREGELVG